MNIPQPIKPKFLNEEQMYNRYSVDQSMKHYKAAIYPKQREGWFYGRVTREYRERFDKIKWEMGINSKRR